MNDKHENLQMVTFRMTPTELAHLDQIAKRVGRTRSDLIRNMVKCSMEEFDAFNKIGVISAALTVRDVVQMITNNERSTAFDLDDESAFKA